MRNLERRRNYIFDNHQQFHGQHRYFDFYKGSTSFYFTNFPENYDNEEMWKIFLKWGTAIDIYIPNRKDRTARKFGFVKFLNPKALEVKLDNIWIGTYKLRVNAMKFVRDTDRGAMKSDYAFKEAAHNGKFFVGNRSYANVVVGGRSNDQPKTSNPHSKASFKEKTWSGIEFNVSEEEMAWLKGSYMGKTIDLEGLLCLKKKIIHEGLLSVTLTSIGGIRC